MAVLYLTATLDLSTLNNSYKFSLPAIGSCSCCESFVVGQTDVLEVVVVVEVQGYHNEIKY